MDSKNENDCGEGSIVMTAKPECVKLYSPATWPI